MKAQPSRTRPPGNALLVIDFVNLMRDEVLKEVFYPKSEDRPADLLTFGQEHHPLHPSFAESPGGLLGTAPRLSNLDVVQAAQVRRIEAHWRVITAHDFYKALTDDRHFQKARDTFRRLQKRSPLEQYRHPFAEFRFVRLAGQFIGLFGCRASTRRKTPSTREREIAVRRIDKVLESLDAGIGFGEFLRTYQLSLTLAALKTELTGPYKKPRDDDNAPFRDFNCSLTNALIRQFGEASTAIVKHFARAIDSPMDDRTIEIHVAETRKRMNSAESGH